MWITLHMSHANRLTSFLRARSRSVILIGTLSKYCRQITQLGLGPGRPPALLPPVPRKRETLLAFGFCRFAFRNYRILAIRSSRSRRRARIGHRIAHAASSPSRIGVCRRERDRGRPASREKSLQRGLGIHASIGIRYYDYHDI